MQTDCLELPEHALMKKHVIESLSPYWPRGRHLIEGLQVAHSTTPFTIKLPLRLCEIAIPDWAQEWAVNGVLLVPEELFPLGKSQSDENLWQDVDWFAAIFIMLEAWHERAWEAKYGPIHSYSFRLKNWDYRVWEKAWVNRISLFLREWATNKHGGTSVSLFGALPKSNFLVTHDVDALNKTLAIRLKQGAFTGFNTLINLVAGRGRASLTGACKTLRILFGREDWWTFNDLLSLEKDIGIHSTFHFHADPSPKTLKSWLFDPGYCSQTKRVRNLFLKILAEGHQIGLHPGFDSWDNRSSMVAQKNKLEAASKTKISACRQHWLRFCWEKTWLTQEDIGLTSDTTLMFNDRPGFRNSSALNWHPWKPSSQGAHKIKVRPTVLMDSHFYDYQQLTVKQRSEQLNSWLVETHAVHGDASVLWHPHTLTRDYGWRDGFIFLLNNIKKLS